MHRLPTEIWKHSRQVGKAGEREDAPMRLKKNTELSLVRYCVTSLYAIMLAGGDVLRVQLSIGSTIEQGQEACLVEPMQ